ncbi:hypothetical protein OSB04_016586 [Centaurea solstitialis]|uniref:GAG-pre-integrase domain-containing protein n=1 Tax=Centaurea solstitialis TaxID=347529 RepID=A0AA38TEG7_9ASTR|nr:hypothetical protein OSB04_016586 [Centaurea solstitialis]
MTGQRSFLFDYVERLKGYIKTVDKTPKPMLGYGKITHGRYIIKDVRYVEGLGYNMFSSSQFCDNGYWVKQFLYGSDVNDEDGNVVLSARRNGNLYSTIFRSIPQAHPQFEALSQPMNAICLLSKASKKDSWLWHRRLCHQNFKDMNKLVSRCLVKGLPETCLSKDTLCPACEKGKMRRSLHPPKMDTNNKSPLDMIHMDMCGPIRVESMARKKYMLVLVDEFSRFTQRLIGNPNGLLPELSTAPPSTDFASNSFASDFIDFADYDLPTLTGPIVVPAHAGSSTTSVSSDAFVTEPSSSTSTNSVTPESVVSPPETSSAEPSTVASPEPVREQTTHPVLAPISEDAPLPSPSSAQRTNAQVVREPWLEVVLNIEPLTNLQEGSSSGNQSRVLAVHDENDSSNNQQAYVTLPPTRKWIKDHPPSQIIGVPLNLF